MALTDQEVEIVTLIEQLFWETGGLPTNEVVAERLVIKVETVQNAWKKEIFRQALIARGINLSPGKSDLNLTAPQMLLVNMLLNTHDKRSIRQKLEAAGVTSQQYHAWTRQEAFRNYITKRAEEAFKAADPSAYLGLVKAVETGDVNALKLFFEMRGIYNPKVEVQVNLEGILLRVVEVVAKYVEPAQMAQIAEELEGLSGVEVQLPQQRRAIPAASFDLKGI